VADDFSGYNKPEVTAKTKPDPENPALLFPRDYALRGGILVREDSAAPAHDYSDGDEVETRIADVIRAASDRSLFSHALRAGITDWPSLYHLSSKRANLLRPFASRIAGRRVLEVGAGCGAISRYLGELAAGPEGGEIVALESSLRRAGIARLRTEDLPCVQVVCDDLFRFVPERPFDVVVVVGVLEYARLFQEAATRPEQALLRRLNGFLRQGGLLVLAIENQLGLKYLAGAPEDHLGQPYYGIENRYGANTAVTFGRRELDMLFQEAGFVSRQVYVPFPDYKMPTLVISPRGLSHAGFNAGALAAEAVVLGEDTRFSLQAAWPVVARNGVLEDLANSFLILASTAAQATAQSDADVLAWQYNTGRGYPFSKETRFVTDNMVGDAAGQDSISVVRTALFARPADFEVPIDLHLETERYLKRETWWFRLIAILGRRGWTVEELGAWSCVWLDALCARAGDCALHADGLVDGSLVDATPFNLIMGEDGTPVFIDQEWQVKRQLPLGFIAVRSLRDSICKIAHIALPADPDLFCVDRIVHAVLTRHGMLLAPSDFDRYTQLEALLQAWVAGSILPAANSLADDSYRRPIQWHLPGGASARDSEIEEERRQHAAEIVVIQTENARLRDTINALTERSELAERDFEGMLNSTSWWLTAPCRRMVGLFPAQLRLGLRQCLKRVSGRL
jgi:SAM-dependent methyltransferase